MYAQIFKEAKNMKEEMVQWRRRLHQIPETGLDLPQTAAFVREKLDSFQIPYDTLVNGNCIVAHLGKGEGCLLLRADMDALPMKEETGLPFASQNDNMHACGHDLHAAALLAAAKILKSHEEDLKCAVKLMFQPAEEIFAGARSAIGEGVLENPQVDAAMVIHVDSTRATGNIAYGTQCNASVYGFKITLKGKGTHGAMPQDGIDPINAGVHLYLGLQELIARECNPCQDVVLTIGQFSAGNTANVIPEQAVLQGTLRAFDKEVRTRLIQRIKEVIQGVSVTCRVQAELEVLSDVPALCTDEEGNVRFAEVFSKMSPGLKIHSGVHSMASEDFAFVSERVPSSCFMIGAKPAEVQFPWSHHNPRVCFSEDAIPIAAAVYACAALSWQRQ